MIHFLFWNTCKHAPDNHLIALIKEYQCSIVVLAEYSGSIDGLCNKLSLHGFDFRELKSPACERIRIISDCHAQSEPLQDDAYTTIHKLTVRGKTLNLAGVHLPSKLSLSEDDQAQCAIISSNLIQDAISRSRCSNTVILGDFNMDPYENGLLSATGFHALPCMYDVSKKTRTVLSKEYPMLYNPTWNLFGDFNLPPGSYRYKNSSYFQPVWHIFDQVLLSPSIMESLVPQSLQIVTRASSASLVSPDGIPVKSISDHLPLLFALNEEEWPDE